MMVVSGTETEPIERCLHCSWAWGTNDDCVYCVWKGRDVEV